MRLCTLSILLTRNGRETQRQEAISGTTLFIQTARSISKQGPFASCVLPLKIPRETTPGVERGLWLKNGGLLSPASNFGHSP